VLLTLDDGTAVLIDTSTDLRSQALAFGIRRLDAVLFTHSHADHVLGLDDVRAFNYRQPGAVPCYGDAATVAAIRRMFAYIFEPAPADGGGIPKLALFTIGGAFSIARVEFVPVPLLHGRRPILGYRVGGFAYLTDCSAIPDGSWRLLEGLDTVVVDALRERPHPTHFSLSEALAVVARLGPRRAYLTHMCHELPHAATNARLPAGVELAYDGLVIEVPAR
jgi:phosphoribosyl 1,2-cyclic phosphate phosphodiesterase